MSVSIVVIAEADADRRTGCDLADRVFCDEIGWIEPSVLDAYREYRGVLGDRSLFTSWAAVADEARRRRLRVHGHFDGSPGFPDAATTRNALRLIDEVGNPASALLLLRDEDGDPRRRDGIQQAMATVVPPYPVVIGFAIPKREAWVLAGFEARSDHENTLLARLAGELGFDPTRLPQDLRGGRKDPSPRNPKVTVERLCGNDEQRQQQCWTETPLPILRDRGRGCGLSEYLDELADLAGRVFKSANR